MKCNTAQKCSILVSNKQITRVLKCGIIQSLFCLVQVLFFSQVVKISESNAPTLTALIVDRGFIFYKHSLYITQPRLFQIFPHTLTCLHTPLDPLTCLLLPCLLLCLVSLTELVIVPHFKLFSLMIWIYTYMSSLGTLLSERLCFKQPNVKFAEVWHVICFSAGTLG